MTGAELREIRQKLGLSQHKLAPQLGLHWNTLARFERGEINISGPVAILARLLLKLAEAEQKEERKAKRKK
jgi:DNA-binding transcriptional regulator YiaG